MIETSFLEQYSQATQLAECRLIEYNKFIKMYNLNEEKFFMDKLLNAGYSRVEAIKIIMNKDLLLSIFMNDFSFYDLMVETDEINIDLELEKIRRAYMDSVDIANQSIEAANEAEKVMIATRNFLESKFGVNTNLWNNDSIKELNEAISLYNRLVEKADSDAEYVKVAREELSKVRLKYSQKVTFDIDEKKNENYNIDSNVRDIVIETN